MDGSKPVQCLKNLQYAQRNRRHLYARLSNNCANPDSAWMCSINRQATKYGAVKAQLHFHTTEHKIPTAVRKIHNVGKN
jgi:hypothetical protein